MKALIDKTYAQENLQIAVGFSDKEFEQYVFQAQQFELKKRLNEAFYMRLPRLKEALIFTGGTYVYQKETYHHCGLALVIAYFAYAYMFMKAPLISTSHGFVIKETPESSPMALQDRKNMYYKYIEHASELFDEVNTYAQRLKIEGWEKENPCQTKGPKTTVYLF